jgi:hypothetical protein
MSLPLLEHLKDPAFSSWLQLGLIVLATLASEDLTCLGVC